MRSLPISFALLEYCLAMPIIGFCWSMIICNLFAIGRLGSELWFVLNIILYISTAFYLLNNTVALKQGRWTSFIDRLLLMLGVVFAFFTIVSTYWVYRVLVWATKFEFYDTFAGTDTAILMLVGIINGLLLGLSILTIGYHWLPQDRQKRKP